MKLQFLFLVTYAIAIFVPVVALKKLVSVFILLGLFVNCISFLAIKAGYDFNKAYIASVLCNNRNKPNLHCEGKCFLDQKLKDLEKKNKQQQENLKRSIETFECSKLAIPLPQINPYQHLTNYFYLLKHQAGIASSIFHPPLA